MAGGLPGNPERMIVCGALEYRLSLPGLLGQVRIRGGWREGEWQKASVLELVGLMEKCREERERDQHSSGYVENLYGPYTGLVPLTKAQGVPLRRS